jgi:hypothetical protein
MSTRHRHIHRTAFENSDVHTSIVDQRSTAKTLHVFSTLSLLRSPVCRQRWWWSLQGFSDVPTSPREAVHHASQDVDDDTVFIKKSSLAANFVECARSSVE